MRIRGLVVLAPVLLVLLVVGARAHSGSVFGDPRRGEADRVARVVADAVSYPRQRTAAGLVRAVAMTEAARSGRLVVVGADELDAASPTDPLAHLVFREDFPASPSTGFGSADLPPLTVCYDVDFDAYGVTGAPRRRDCPARTTAVPVPPAPLVMEVAPGSDVALLRVLRRLPAGVDDMAARGAVLRALPAVPATAVDPEVRVATQGADVGVSVRGAEDCLLGRVRDGRVQVWRPARVQVQPGELSCDPATALLGGGIRAPH